MGKQKARTGGKKKKNNAAWSSSSNINNQNGEMIWVDPDRVRFQHARIRPVFSGCGRSLTFTLDAIRQGSIQPSDLPPIQVMVGPVDETDGRRWYFSLNNRRLWVLKRCREEGLLSQNGNQIQVRVRTPKSSAEAQRYTLANCAVEAKVMRESTSKNREETNDKQDTSFIESSKGTMEQSAARNSQDKKPDETLDEESSESDDDDDDDDSVGATLSNRFSALL